MKKIWPDGIKCGVAFTFDLDAETFWFSRTMDSKHSVNLMAEGSYGPNVALPRILDMLDRQDLYPDGLSKGIRKLAGKLLKEATR